MIRTLIRTDKLETKKIQGVSRKAAKAAKNTFKSRFLKNQMIWFFFASLAALRENILVVLRRCPFITY